MKELEKLINISGSILKLYRHIIELEENNQDTTAFYDIVKRLSKLESEILEFIINDNYTLLNKFLDAYDTNDYDIYKIILTNQLDCEELLMYFRIIHKSNIIFPTLDNSHLLNFVDEDIAMIQKNSDSDIITNIFFDLLLTKAYDKTISNLEMFYIQKHLSEQTIISSEINISKIRRYQILTRYLYPSLENNSLSDNVSNILRMEKSNETQKIIFELTIYNVIIDEINFIINSILYCQENSSYYETNSSTLYLLYLSSLEAYLNILNDSSYIQIRDDLNVKFDELLQNENNIKYFEPIILIRNQFDKRNEKIIEESKTKQQYKKAI